MSYFGFPTDWAGRSLSLHISRYWKSCHGAVKSDRGGIKNASRRLRGYAERMTFQARPCRQGIEPLEMLTLP